MALKVTLKKEATLSDNWMQKEDFERVFKNDKAALIELLKEDTSWFLEDIGGLDSLIESFEWVDDAPK